MKKKFHQYHPSIKCGLIYLKYCIKIEKKTINFYPLSKNNIYIKWLPFETDLGVWNFSAVLLNVCIYKLNVFCLCKIVCACHMVFFLLSLLFLKNKQITKTIPTKLNNPRSPQLIVQTKRPWHMKLEIQDLAWDRHKNVTCSPHDIAKKKIAHLVLSNNH